MSAETLETAPKGKGTIARAVFLFLLGFARLRRR